MLCILVAMYILLLRLSVELVIKQHLKSRGLVWYYLFSNSNKTSQRIPKQVFPPGLQLSAGSSVGLSLALAGLSPSRQSTT